jgi:hypothetical protein
MLTLDERGGEESGVEMRPECCPGLPECPRQGARSRWRAVKRVPLSPRGQKTLACEVATAVSNLGDGDGPRPSGKYRPRRGPAPVHLGNVGLDIARQFGGAYGLGVIYAQAMVGKGPND